MINIIKRGQDDALLIVSPQTPLGVAVIYPHVLKGMHPREFWFQNKSTGNIWRLEIWSNKIDAKIFSGEGKDLEFSEHLRGEKSVEIYNWANDQFGIT